MTIGAHTRTHPYLPNVRDSGKLWDEIAGSKRILEGHLGKNVDVFAFPYGHYTPEAIQVIKNAGFLAARTTYRGVYHTADDLYTLKGVEISDDMDAFIAAVK
jgi:peptidoglycan/xylan/chitin deacetylase (PgdA/CDA1 family)